MKLRLVFSMITGDIYTIEEDEMRNLDKYQVPLLRRPKDNCKKCYGRLYSHYNVNLKLYVLCNKCVNSCVDFSNYSDDIEVESFKHD